VARNILCAFLLAVALAACGGGGSDDRLAFDDTAPSTQVSRASVYPISRNYATGGTYAVVVSGQFAVTNFAGPDQLAVWFSFSGHGTLTGAAQPTYAISANGQIITVSQSVTVTTSGAGPWQMEVLCFTGGSTGTMTNLTMHSVLN
jgi:hypothetical protein